MTLRRLVACAGMLLGFWSGPAAAQALGSVVRETYSTNFRMLEEVAESAVNELMIGFKGPESGLLLVESASDHEANWFIENLLLSKLADAGYEAYLKAGEPLGPPIPPVLMDSVRTAEAESPPDTTIIRKLPTAEDAEHIFRYRVVEFGISYPSSYRKSPLGGRQVHRLARANLQAHLLEGKRQHVRWGNTANSARSDVVPAGKLKILAGADSPFPQPAIEGKGLSGLVEPALVTGIVVGLVYLFYANQN